MQFDVSPETHESGEQRNWGGGQSRSAPHGGGIGLNRSVSNG